MLVMLCALPPSYSSAQPRTEPQVLRTALPWTIAPRSSLSAHRLPARAPRAVIHAPSHLDLSQPLRLVVFLHGWSGCSRVLGLSGQVACIRGGTAREGWGLIAKHEEAGTNTIFIIPQLAWMQRSGRAGRFRSPGFAQSWLRRLVTEHIAPRLSAPNAANLVLEAPITLLAHSAGYETALAWLEDESLAQRIDSVVLFDALYAGEEAFWQWAQSPQSTRRVLSIHGSGGTPRRHTRALRRLAGLSPDSPTAPLSVIDGAPVHSLETRVPHADIPHEHLVEVLSQFGGSRR